MKKQVELSRFEKRRSPGGRMISTILVVCMVFCLLPGSAMAIVGDAVKVSQISSDISYYMRASIYNNSQYCVVSEGDPGLGADFYGYPLPSKSEGAKAVLSPIPDSRGRHPLDLMALGIRLEHEGKYFRIKVYQSGLYLTAQGEGQSIVQMPKGSFGKQLFELIAVKSGSSLFNLKASDGTYVTVEGAKADADSGTGLIAAPLNTNAINNQIQQEFSFCPIYTDNPKMSDWAKPYLIYMPRDTAYGNDFTKPFHMTGQALFDIVTGLMPSNPKYLPGAIADTAVGSESDGVLWRLKYWGILPASEIPNESKATKEGFAVYLMRTINYLNKYCYQNTIKLSRADLSNYSDGGQVGSWAKDAMAVMVAHGVMNPSEGRLNPQATLSIEDALIMCGRVRCIFAVQDNPFKVKDGVYSVRNLLGNSMAINAAGQGELNAYAKQSFRFTYKYTQATSTNDCSDYYTIQTLDGKYLAIDGTAVEGSPLIVRDQEYLWRVITSSSENYQNTYVLMPAGEWTIRVLSAYKGETRDGTPLVTWKKSASATEKDWKAGNAGGWAYEPNAKFYLDAQ